MRRAFEKRNKERGRRALAEALEGRRLLSAGALDTSWGVGGIIAGPYHQPVGEAIASSAIQADGQLLVGGAVYQDTAGATSEWMVRRYSASGILDTAFGTAGEVLMDLSAGFDAVEHIVPQPDGKIILIGGQNIGTTSTDGAWVVGRLNADGSPDTAFGVGGSVIKDFGTGSDIARSGFLQPDGKIVAVGASWLSNKTGERMTIARFNSDGSFDTTFGTSGITTVTAGTIAIDVAPLSDGRIIMTGDDSAQTKFITCRFTTGGILDTSYGTAGVSTISFSGVNFSVVNAMGLQSDGRAVLVGRFNSGITDSIEATRLNADGSLDTSFATAGFLRTKFTTGFPAYATSVAILPDGKILMGGTQETTNSPTDWGFERLTTAGQPDQTFGLAGVTTFDFQSKPDSLLAMSLLPDGSFIGAGVSNAGQPPVRLAIAKFIGDDGSPIAAANGPYSGSEIGTISLSAAGSTSSDGSALAYEWDTNYNGTFVPRVTGSSPTLTDLDGPATFTVALRVTDTTGRSNIAFTLMTISGSPPTATVQNYSINPNNAGVTLSNFSDAAADMRAGFKFSYDFDGDGLYDVVDVDSPHVAVPPSYLKPGSARVVNVRIKDKDGGNSLYSTTLNVPAATGITAGAPSGYVLEGGTTTLTDTGASSAFGSIVNWEWDTNYNGATFVSRATGRSITFSAAGLDGPATRAIALRVTDSLGNQAIGAGSVNIRNVAPALGATGPATFSGTGPVLINLQSTDPGPDSITSWVIDWGDGQVAQTFAGNPTSVAHTYKSSGNFNITGTASDEDGSYEASLLGIGSIDTTFGVSGRIIDGIGGMSANHDATVVQSDGKIVELSSFFQIFGVTSGTVGRLSRYNVDGSLDTTFGSTGRVFFNQYVGNGTFYGPLILQPDGKIIVVDNTQSFVERFTTTGIPDTTFGYQGRVSFLNNTISSAMLQNDGKVLVVLGTTAISRLNADGSVDTAFGTTGRATLPTISGTVTYQGVTSTSAGKILIAGNVDVTSGSNFQELPVLVTLNADGSVDRSHYSNGYTIPALPNVTTTTYAHVASIILNSDGKITLGGEFQSQNGGASSTLMLLRYNADGTADTSLGGAGYFISPTLRGASSIKVQSDGKILAAGRSESQDIPIYRLNADGSSDTGFGASGTAFIPGQFFDRSDDVAIASDGSVIVAGVVWGNLEAFPEIYRLRARSFNVIAPLSASFSSGGSVNEGSTGVIRFSNQSGTAPFTYSYDFDNDGVFEVTNSTSTSVTVPATYFAEGPGTRVAHGRISQGDGQFVDYTTSITINNVAPTATLAGGSVVVGGTGTITFSGATDPSSADIAAGFKFSYDFNNDGVFEITNSTASSATVPSSYLPTTGLYIVRGRITDRDGAFTNYTSSIVVNTLAITARVASSGYAVDEGATTLLYDAGSTSNVGSIVKWEWDTNYNGTTFNPVLNGQTATFSAAGLDGLSTRAIALRVTDSQGHTATATSLLTINNVAPVLSATVSVAATAGIQLTVNLASADPGPDTISRWIINWGDGTAASTYAGNPSSVTHTFATGGNYSVVATVKDEDGSYSQNLLGAGSVDPAFAANGRLRDTFEGIADDAGTQIALQPDGKILMADKFNDSQLGALLPNVLRIARYNTDGSIDTTFASNGVLLVPSGVGIGVQAGKGILVGTFSNFAGSIFRYTFSGALDTTFGTGGSTPVSSGSGTPFVQPDGKIVTTTFGHVSRFTADGAPDTAFGTNGVGSFTPISGSISDQLNFTSIGQYLAGGSTNNATTYFGMVLGLTPAGFPDPSFGTGGISEVSIPGKPTTTLLFGGPLAIQPDGKILMLGSYQDAGSPFQSLVFRLTSTGLLDTTFGAGTGCAFIPAITQPTDIALQPDGKILLSAFHPGEPQLARLNSDGSIDTTFGTNGAIVMSTGFVPVLSDVIVQPDGSILLSGHESAGTPALYKIRSQPFSVAQGAAIFNLPTSVNEGSSASISFTNPTGPGPFTYSFDFNNDGIFEITGSTASSATVPASYFADGPGLRTVIGRITGPGGSTDLPGVIAINNVVPTVSSNAFPTGVQEGNTVTLAATALDVSPIDTAAGFTFKWQLSKTGSPTINATGNPLVFVLPDDGNYSVSVTATDKDGGVSWARLGKSDIQCQRPATRSV